MGTSRRPLVDMFGCTWLGDPEGAGVSIEIADDFIGLYEADAETRIPWSDIAELDVDIPTAAWPLAVSTYWLVSIMDALEGLTGGGATTTSTTSASAGQKVISVRIVRRDGTEVTGSARKHQILGYPRPEAQAAIAVLRGRISPPPETPRRP